MIKSFMSKCNEAMMGELYGGDIWGTPFCPTQSISKQMSI